MRLICFLFFQCKTAFNVNTCHVRSQTFHSCFPLFDVDHLQIANCSNLTAVFYPLGNFGQALCIRSCHEDLIVTRKSHNCSGIAFIQGDSAGGSKLIEQTLNTVRFAASQFNKINRPVFFWFQTVCSCKTQATADKILPQVWGTIWYS